MRNWKCIAGCLLLILLVACGSQKTSEPIENDQDDPIVSEDPTEDPVPKEKDDEPEYPYTAPLTGMGTEEKIDRRVIDVMIDNSLNARPQSGLAQADIVFEILEEGWITRFNALFQSKEPEVVGPIRSIRPYNIELALGYDAAMAHAGGSPKALNILRNNGYADLDEIYNSGAYFWRESFRPMPHNLYSDLDQLRQGIEDHGYRETSEIPNIKFKPKDQEMTGEPAGKVNIHYTSQYEVGYEYDPSAQKYLRFTEGKPHKDLNTKEQYAVTNVLVITAPHRIIDHAGRREIDLSGPGDGYLFQRGKAIQIKWRKEDGIIRVYKDGTEVGFYPGNTWINLIPNVPGLNELVQFEE